MIVLDTNVLSESVKTPPSDRVLEWIAKQERSRLFITAITQAELLYGIEVLPEGKRREILSDAIEKLFSKNFHERILPFDERAARVYGRIASARRFAGRPIAEHDAMIAAIARSRQAAVATRNTKDFEHCGVALINPWNE
jgi:predicted nucleic acid-binding protein